MIRRAHIPALLPARGLGGLSIAYAGKLDPATAILNGG
jgi:hypothetical protein